MLLLLGFKKELEKKALTAWNVGAFFFQKCLY